MVYKALSVYFEKTDIFAPIRYSASESGNCNPKNGRKIHRIVDYRFASCYQSGPNTWIGQCWYYALENY
jgi:hypothetical protein